MVMIAVSSPAAQASLQARVGCLKYFSTDCPEGLKVWPDRVIGTRSRHNSLLKCEAILGSLREKGHFCASSQK